MFEGVTHEAKRVYAYDLVITDKAGQVRRTRDAYSFLPTLGEADLYLFGKGDERRIYDKLGSHLRQVDGVAGASFAVWAPNAQRSAWWVISTTGTAAVTRCVRWAPPGCGRFSFPG